MQIILKKVQDYGNNGSEKGGNPGRTVGQQKKRVSQKP